MTALELIKQYLTLFFVDHKPEKILDILTEDIHSFGLAEERSVKNIGEARELLKMQVYRQFLDYKLCILEETEISAEAAYLVYTLAHENVTVKYRLTGAARNTKDGLKLYLLDSSYVDSRHKLSMFSDIAREEIQKDVLKNSMPGGIMGAYLEKDFPFYCINDAMLSYLGYESESEFCESIGGLVSNCIHPEDRERVYEIIADKTSKGEGYSVEYRLCKKNKTYIWIHESGRKISAEDGRYALVSACYDITERVEIQKQLSDIVQNVPGGVCMYRCDGKTMTPIIISERAEKLLGKDIGLSSGKIMEFENVYPDDVEKLRELVRNNIENPGVTYSQTYRALDKKSGSYFWVQTTGVAKRQEDGTSIIYAAFADVDSEKQIETRLRQEEEILESACKFANIWTWVYNIRESSVHCSEQLRKDFGVPEYLDNYPDSWLSMEFIKPEFSDLYREKIMAVKNGSQYEEFDARIYNLKGELHWYRISMNKFEDNDSLVICTSRIVDNEKFLEARIEVEQKQQSEGGANLLAHFVTNITKNMLVDYTYRFQETPELLKWDSLDAQLELTKKYIVNSQKRKEFLEIHNPDFLQNNFAKGISNHFIEYRRQFPDGKIIWVRTVIHLVQDPKTGDILNYEYIYDIHRQKISEELMSAVVSFGYELCASLMVDSNQVTILRSEAIFGKKGLEVVNYTEANRAYAEKFIIEEDRQMYLDACSPENISEQLKTKDFFEIIHRTFENGVIHYKKDQCYGYSEHHTTCLLVRSDITGIVTEERKKQENLKRALEAAEAATLAKSEFLSRMSHEIRTPMNAIMGMTAIAKDSSSDFSQVVECLDKIDMSSRFLLTLINDILEMSRIESGRTEIKHTEFSFDFLIQSIRTVVEPLALKSGVRLEYINNAKTDSHYVGDSMRIQQVLVNIITNAIKFTKNGGRVRFSVNIESETDELASFCFVIADTGIGMSEDFMKRMFKPFTQEDGSNTSQFGGSGLGLAISKSLTEAMNGTISVDSIKGIGSTFRVHLPLDKMHGNVSCDCQEKYDS